MTEPTIDPPAGFPAEASKLEKRPVAAVAGVVGYFFLAVLGAAALYFPSLLLQTGELGVLDAWSDDATPRWVEVFEFDAAQPEGGDRRGLRAATEREGISARWHFGVSCNRVAFDCPDLECHEAPTDDIPRLSRLFTMYGFSIDEGSRRLVPDHRAQLRSPWASAVVGGAVGEMLTHLPLFLVGFLARRNLRNEPPEVAEPGREASTIGPWQAIAIGVTAGGGLAMLTLLARGIDGMGPLAVLHDASYTCGSVSSAGAMGLVLTGLLTVGVAPVAEEMFFRGWAVPYLEARAGTLAVYLGSAGLWALLHATNATVVPFLLGLVLVWSYRKTRRLVLPLTIHAAFNAVVLIHWWQSRPPF